jgi:hypothetical protein
MITIKHCHLLLLNNENFSAYKILVMQPKPKLVNIYSRSGLKFCFFPQCKVPVFFSNNIILLFDNTKFTQVFSLSP